MELTMVLPKANSAFSAITGTDCRTIGSSTRGPRKLTAFGVKLKALSPMRLKRTAKANMVSSDSSEATAIMTSPLSST